MLKGETNGAGKERLFIRDFMSVKTYEEIDEHDSNRNF
jgi:hypothetical protein